MYQKVISILSMREKYHPIRDCLFRKYSFPVLTLFMNLIVGGSCLLLLLVAFYGLYCFFYAIENNASILGISASLIFMFSFLTTVKSVYSFLYSGKDVPLLKSLPVKRSEILVSHFIYFYKKIFFVALYVLSSSVYVILMKDGKIIYLGIGILLLLIIPALAISCSMFLSSIVNFVILHIKIKDRNKQLSFKKMSVFHTLIKFERNNISKFSSLRLEILSSIVASLLLVFLLEAGNFKVSCFIMLYPVLSMINVSSFSREGAFHNILQTLPITEKNRVLAKIVFYLCISVPIIVICFLYTYIKTRQIILLLSLIPNILFIVGLSVIGVKAGQRCPNIYWTNPQESLRMNYPVLFGGLLVAVITEGLVFFPELFFITNIYIGLVCAIAVNLILIMYGILKSDK